MKKPHTAKAKTTAAEITQPFKKIGIAAVAAAAHAMKPRQDKAAQQKDTPPILLQEHWVL